MLDFVRKTFLGVGAALVLGVAAPAGAATFAGGGWTGSNPSCNVTGSAANNFSTINVLSGASFTATFKELDAGGNLCFNFYNSSATAAAVTVAAATVNQNGVFSGFKNGVQLFSQQSGPAALWTVTQGVLGNQSFTFTIGALSTIFFDWTYGDPYAKGFAAPFINFSVNATPAAIPVPAAGLLLLGALGGLGALRRRRTV